MKGALVELKSGIGGSVPNVIVFQYNPETLRHTIAQPAPAVGTNGHSTGNALGVPAVPTETFSFSLSMDVTDQFADPDPSVAAEAARSGIYTRLAALELLMYPVTGGQSSTGTSGGTGGTSGTGTGAGGASSTGGGERRPTPAAQLPTVLFVWGADRILPVRVTSLSITEKLYDDQLNPTHAEAQLELRVLTPEELRAIGGQLGRFLTTAYTYTQGQRKSRAAANLGGAARAVIGILGDKVLS